MGSNGASHTNHGNQAMSTKKLDNTGPMKALRQKKRDAGLRPKEIWVHESVPSETIKAMEKKLQVPVKSKNS